MDNRVPERLAESLTARSTELIPYLPYLLQDFWSLGADADEIIGLLRAHTDFSECCRVLDLACGKGAVAVPLAKAFGCRVKGVDLLPAFVQEAREKAAEHGVAELCEFAVGDVNETVLAEENYDVAIWGAAGDLLGGYAATVAGVAGTVRPGGYLLFDDAYVEEGGSTLRFGHDYLTRAEWDRLLAETGLERVAETGFEPGSPGDYAEDLGNIRRRAEELAARHPGRRALFEDYVKSQQAEYEDLQDGAIPFLWLLRKRP